jgi:flagellar hook-basal body complex protein FliE
MTPVAPVSPVAVTGHIFLVAPMLQAPSSPQADGFASLLTKGIDSVNTKVLDANRLARAFVLDDAIPVHQVTYALEQARLSLELMTQVRSRLIEGYQQLMNMQL